MIFARPKSVVHSFAVYKFTAGDLNRGLPIMWSNLSDGTHVEGCAREEDMGQRVSVIQRYGLFGYLRAPHPCALECKAFEHSEL